MEIGAGGAAGAAQQIFAWAGLGGLIHRHSQNLILVIRNTDARPIPQNRLVTRSRLTARGGAPRGAPFPLLSPSLCLVLATIVNFAWLFDWDSALH